MKWIASALMAGALARAGSVPFSLSVETAWPAPPLFLEILEVAYDEDPAAYFPLLRLLSKHAGALGEDPSPKDVLERALLLMDSHGLLTAPTQRDTFNMALGLHTAAPRISAAYSAYNVDEDSMHVQNCSSWVEFRGQGYCDAEELRRIVERGVEERGYIAAPPARSLPFDHVSPSPIGDGPQAIFYYSPSPEALPLLEYLDEHARAFPSFQYAVRYRAPKTTSDARTPLSGYGVEMALKKTDYLVVDDRDRASSGRAQAAFQASSHNSSHKFDVLGDDPWAETQTPLTEKETSRLGSAAVALIKSSDNPMSAFVELSQDLPKYSAALARNVKIPLALRIRLDRLATQHPIGPTLLINGRLIRDREINAFSLVDAIRRERRIMNSLLSLGLNPKQAYNLISDPIIAESQRESGPEEGLVDASDRLEGGGVITWINDIENDPQYGGWPDAIQAYLRPLHPGQLHTVRRNTWNVVLVMDLATPRGFEAISGHLLTLVQRSVPIHAGVVPMFDDTSDASAKVAKLMWYIDDALGREFVHEFFSAATYTFPNSPSAPTTIPIERIRDLYEEMRKQIGVDSLPFDDIMALPGYDERLEKVKEYTTRLGANPSDSLAGHVFINGRYLEYSRSWTHSLQQELTQQVHYLQGLIKSRAIKDVDMLPTIFYDLPTTASRRNKFIVPSSDSELQVFNILDVFGDEAQLLSQQFVYPPDEKAGTPLTLWIIGDLDSIESRAVITNAFKHLEREESSTRLGFVHVPTPESKTRGQRFSTMLYQLMGNKFLAKMSPKMMIELLRELDASDAQTDDVVGTGKVMADSQTGNGEASESEPLNTHTNEGWTASDLARSAEFWRIGAKVAKRLNLKSSSPHLLVNGRLIGPVTGKTFELEDFDTLEKYELQKRVHPVINILRSYYDDIEAFSRENLADLISAASSIVSASYMPTGSEGVFVAAPAPRSRAHEQLDEGEISFTVGQPDTALIRIVVIIDPVSEIAQRWSALIQWLSQIDNVATTVYFDPNTEAKEFKVKRFYRSALRSRLTFDVDGQEVLPAPTFNDLPSTPIFTLAMETPSSWIVSPKESPLDLDNLLIGNLQEPTHVLFDLKQLAIDGHGRETKSNSPPRGLQLQLKDGENIVSDTQVMANLGYFQFKATPGLYQLSIRPGRGEEVYGIESVGAEGWHSPRVNETGYDVALASFDGATIYPRFLRRPGMETADVLSTEVAETFAGSVFSRMKEMVGLTPAKKSRHADINIFTVASGLLYERFASIMILSVMKHTQSTVKFWFIENFLSPTFLKFLPKLAEEYNFEYELVTYKWPHWLRAQTEKQRIIWAYKILFLDVLFPMDLDKVIFVDADQIVRTDMKELVDVDLKGHVYGYPPMGNDREEMEGFRFWKTGYWLKELQGKPYHISALYVVDLKRFRQTAAGDRLRGTYQSLSADPNSLANLDQDLPNAMQRQIPIFTLDQDWLWCQTWCSDESLKTAKTIDLCQNPLTKEPKLARARQIPEWDLYDREIARFAATLEDSALAADVDDLAEGPGGKQKVEAKEEAGEEAEVEEENVDEHTRDEL